MSISASNERERGREREREERDRQTDRQTDRQRQRDRFCQYLFPVPIYRCVAGDGRFQRFLQVWASDGRRPQTEKGADQEETREAGSGK